MLSRRELSEAQVRQRLARRGHDSDSIESAVARLKEEKAIDDQRTAAAIARTQTGIKGRGRARVKREMERAGIDRAEARRAIDDVFTQIDEDQLIDTVLARRARGRDLEDDAVFRRLYRFLMGQGFDHERVMKALRSRRTGA